MMKKLSTDGQRIINEDGAHIILNGVNLVCKDKVKGYVYPCDESLFTWYHEQGYNVIRLGLIWDGVEPDPGVYDDNYLALIKQQILWANANGIYIFLDMHQDLYSSLYSDGAPEWATISDGLPHVVGQIWSDAYLESPALNRALDHFWDNSPAVDGIGLQDHYAAMWKHAAEFFSDCTNIIGYDMMNEPYPGSSGQEVFGAFIATYAQTVMGLVDPNMKQLSSLWFDEEQKQEILVGMADMNIYKALVDSAKQPSQAFERDVMGPFFNKTAAAIRSVVPDGFLMLETSYFANMAVESGLELVRNEEGETLHHQVYTPHGYDLVVDTEHYEIYNQDRVEFIFATHRKVQGRLNVPTLIGEWGAFTNHQATFELTKSLVAIFEQYLWSNTYWCWTEGFKETPYAKVLNRAYPQVTGGVLGGYHYNYDTDSIKLDYVSSGTETWIYHPRAALLSKANVVVSGADDYQMVIRPYPNSNGGIIAILVPQSKDQISITVS